MQKIKSITFDRGENSLTSNDFHTTYSWASANDLLREWAISAPQPGDGYHKVYFTLNFDGGDSYRGRFDLKSSHRSEVDLGQDILDQWFIMSGRKQPNWMSDAKWHDAQTFYSDEQRQKATLWLDTFLIETFSFKPYTLVKDPLPVPDRASNSINCVLLGHLATLCRRSIGPVATVDDFTSIINFLYQQGRLVNGVNLHDLHFAAKHLNLDPVAISGALKGV